jgi:pilus assembly protein CpaF
MNALNQYGSHAMVNSTNDDLQSSASMTRECEFQNLTQRIHRELVDKLDLSRMGDLQGDSLRQEVRRVAEQVCDRVCHKEKTLLNRWERERIVEGVLDETFGLGPLEILVKDPTINAVLIKGPREVYELRDDQEWKTPVVFRDNEHLSHIIERIASRDGNQVNVPFPLLESTEDCIVIRHSQSNVSELEVSVIRWSP